MGRLTTEDSWGVVSSREALFCHADNADGWGLATLVAGTFHLAKEPLPAAHSARFRELCGQTRSTLVIGHVRKANPPTARVLANTHPFHRVCCGREWVFAHNGIVREPTAPGHAGATSPCTVSGDTDSEHAFCVVLDRIAAAVASSQTAANHGWIDAVAAAAETIASHGRFNFLMSDGEHLIAYGHDRLHGLVDERTASPRDAATRMAVISTEPLTEAPGWLAFEPGELRVYRRGEQIVRFLTHPQQAITSPSADFER